MVNSMDSGTTADTSRNDENFRQLQKTFRDLPNEIELFLFKSNAQFLKEIIK